MNIEEIQIRTDQVRPEFYGKREVSLAVARLDLMHPEVSGNKWFKLHYFVEACLAGSRTIITCGGAYSNHLLATAFLCRENGIRCVGVVRGEEPKNLSHTLRRCIELGMSLHFIDRARYRTIGSTAFSAQLVDLFGAHTFVPEGGYHPIGAKGASLIAAAVAADQYSHTCSAVGTATTLAGLHLANNTNRQLIAIPALRNMTDIPMRIKNLTLKAADNITMIDGYDFGGYAKYSPALLTFMNEFYKATDIPTDFVYTGKMMYAVTELLRKDYFPEGSKILCLHTGGLQGNGSLPAGMLNF